MICIRNAYRVSSARLNIWNADALYAFSAQYLINCKLAGLTEIYTLQLYVCYSCLNKHLGDLSHRLHDGGLNGLQGFQCTGTFI